MRKIAAFDYEMHFRESNLSLGFSLLISIMFWRDPYSDFNLTSKNLNYVNTSYNKQNRRNSGNDSKLTSKSKSGFQIASNPNKTLSKRT